MDAEYMQEMYRKIHGQELGQDGARFLRDAETMGAKEAMAKAMREVEDIKRGRSSF